MKKILIILVVAILAASAASAQIPRLISYQGILTDDMGIVVADGVYSITFRLYDVEVDGSASWEETLPVTVSKGIFNVTLGNSVMIGEDFSIPLYLAIEIEGGGELSPRRMFTANAHAFSAMGVYGVDNILPAEGFAGIGTVSPTAPLHIYTDISNSAEPTLLLDNVGDQSLLDFRFDGLTQARIRKAGGGDLFLGTLTGQGITFQLNSLYLHRMRPDGSFGINNLTPLEMLDVGGAIRLGSTHSNNAGTIRWSGSDFEGYNGAIWQSLTATGGSLPSGTSGQTLRNASGTWIAVSNLFNSGSRVGIGSTAPDINLHIEEDADDMVGIKITNPNTGTNSSEQITFEDENGELAGIRLYDDTSPSTYAGSMAIYNNRPSGSLLFRTGGVNRMQVQTAGQIDFFDGVDLMTRIWPNPYGGNINLYNETGNFSTASMQADVDESGGYLYVRRNDTNNGLTVDGNYSGTGAPQVSISGPSRAAVFDMSVSGNSSVVLPSSSIGSAEILDEPGVASDWRLVNYNITTSFLSVAGRTIDVPAPGYVLAIGTAEVRVYHTSGSTSVALFGVSDNNTSFPDAQDIGVVVGAAVPTTTLHYPVTVQRIFEVPSSGSFTFYMLAQEIGGNFQVGKETLSLVYLPTSYGTVDLLASGGGDTPSDSDPALERAESEKVNSDRIERELAEMKERIAALESELGNK